MGRGSGHLLPSITSSMKSDDLEPIKRIKSEPISDEEEVVDKVSFETLI